MQILNSHSRRSQRLDQGKTRDDQVASKPSHVLRPRPAWKRIGAFVLGGLLLLAIGGSVLSRYDIAWPVASWQSWISSDGSAASGNAAADDDHDDHDEDGVIELSEQARRNIGLSLVSVAPQEFTRTITVPGVIAERPGRTLLTVSAPLSGIVTQIASLAGEAVAPGGLLAEIRITHDDLADRQRNLLLSIERRDVVRREVLRLEEVAASGAVAGKTFLERQYELQTIEASIRAERQALVLHGLSEQQVDQIVADRQLLSTVEITAPPLAAGEHNLGDYHVVELSVRPGQHVEAGSPLLLLADHCELYVVGKAFEHDAAALHRAADAGLGVRVLVQEGGGQKAEISPLTILYVENQIDRDSRALRFYATLPNQVLRDHQTADGRRFHAWRFKPGQRVEVEIPVERWEDRIVLPVEAVVQEGAHWFVFQDLGDRFLRKEIHVEHRDHRWAVVAADGTLEAGDLVAAKGAYQIHLALKQQAGGGDDHAHHHH
jgi:membrane fusion protein, heavy metal efflux system